MKAADELPMSAAARHKVDHHEDLTGDVPGMIGEKEPDGARASTGLSANAPMREAEMTHTPAGQAETVPPPPRGALAHIPGDEGWPLVGHTLSILADPKGFVEQRVKRYGLVHRTRVFGETNVALLGPNANELMLLDPQKNFSSTFGWGRSSIVCFPAD